MYHVCSHSSKFVKFLEINLKKKTKKYENSDLPDSNQRPKDNLLDLPLQSSALPTELRSAHLFF